MQDKIILFAAAYVEVPLILYFIEQGGLDSDICVCFSKKDLYVFFQYLNKVCWGNKIKLVHCREYAPPDVKYKNKLLKLIDYSLQTVKRLRQIYNNYFADRKGYKVYFFSKGAVPYYFYIIKRLSRNNKIYLIENGVDIKDKVFPYYVSDFSLKNLAWDLYYKLIFDRYLQLSSDNVWVFPYISSRYIAKYVHQEIDVRNMEEDICHTQIKYAEKQALQVHYKMIFFDDDLSGYIDNNKQDVFYRRLRECFKSSIDNIFAIKLHPGQRAPSLEGAGKDDFNVIDSYIPGEFLFNKRTRFYVSYLSNVIFNVEHLIDKEAVRVMLLYLIPFKEESRRNIIMKYMERMIKGKIYFPKTFEELEKILKGNAASSERDFSVVTNQTDN